MKRTAATPWWAAYVTAFVLLLALDAPFRSWVPSPPRFPESFSAAYLAAFVGGLAAQKNLVVVLGDSVVRGYRLDEKDTAVAALRSRLPGYHVVNLAFDGGSLTNSELMVRYLLRRRVRPKLVIFNVNMKEFNPADNAYRRVHPALEHAAFDVLTVRDRHELDFLPVSEDFNARLGHAMELYWAFYRYRSDIRERIFGTDDLASWLTNLAGRITGYTARKEAAHAVTPERFFATYDLTPLDDSNIGFRRLRSAAAILSENQIPAVAFITPTNHRLLHQYIDNPDYQENVHRVIAVLRRPHVVAPNLDAAIRSSDFLDNDHMNRAGNQRLAELLLPAIRNALR